MNKYSCWIFLILIASVSYQQEEMEITFDNMKTLELETAYISIFEGNVKVKHSLANVDADRVVLFSGAKEEKETIRELYAEGNVIINRPGLQIRADKFYYSLLQKKGIIIRPQLRWSPERTGVSYIIKAEEAVDLGEGNFLFENLSFTTCEFPSPHYSVSVARAKVHFIYKQKTPRLSYFEVKDLLLKIMDIPILYLPWFTMTPTGEAGEFPLKRVRVGRTRRFGYYTLMDWGFTIPKAAFDKINIFEPDLPEDNLLPWGELTLETDYRSERGPALGLDLEYKGTNYQGLIDTYYLRDKGPDPDISYNRKFLEFDPVKDKDRYRVKYLHDHKIRDNLLLQLELSYLSDRHLLEEFFEKEFKESKEQETAIYTKWWHKNLSLYYWQRHRLNDFQTQLEALPLAKFYIFEEQLLPNLFLFQTLELANLRLMYDEKDPLDRDSYRSLRADIVSQLAYPLNLDFLNIYPYLQTRFTSYSQSIEGDPISRCLTSAGAKINSNFYKIYPMQSSLLNAEKLRHTIELNTTYLNNFYTSASPDKLLKFDNVDYLGEFEEVSLEIKNRLDVKTPDSKIWQMVEFTIGAEYYPDPQRDTTRRVVDTYFLPAYFVRLPPEHGIYEKRQFSNIHLDFVWNLPGILSLRYNGEIDPIEGEERAREIAIFIKPYKDVEISIGQMFFDEITNAVGGKITLGIWEWWKMWAEAQYDFRVNRYVFQKASLVRDFHDFILELSYEYDTGKREPKFLFYIYPKLFAKAQKLMPHIREF